MRKSKANLCLLGEAYFYLNLDLLFKFRLIFGYLEIRKLIYVTVCKIKDYVINLYYCMRERERKQSMDDKREEIIMQRIIVFPLY